MGSGFQKISGSGLLGIGPFGIVIGISEISGIKRDPAGFDKK
jgi:hypothetical protein